MIGRLEILRAVRKMTDSPNSRANSVAGMADKRSSVKLGGMVMLAVAFAVSGCGGSGPDKQEVHQAFQRGYEQGEKSGETKAATAITQELRENYNAGRKAGYAEGFDAGEEEGFAIDEEIEEAVAKEFEEEEEMVEAGDRGERESTERLGEEAFGEARPSYLEEEELNPYPEKENGERSYEFEPEDIERAEEASEELREYCAGAVSEAQYEGCLSHAEVP